MTLKALPRISLFRWMMSSCGLLFNFMFLRKYIPDRKITTTSNVSRLGFQCEPNRTPEPPQKEQSQKKRTFSCSRSQNHELNFFFQRLWIPLSVINAFSVFWLDVNFWHLPASCRKLARKLLEVLWLRRTKGLWTAHFLWTNFSLLSTNGTRTHKDVVLGKCRTWPEPENRLPEKVRSDAG